MADNVTVDNAALTDYDVRTDEDGSGKHYQLVKLAFGADDVFTRVESGVGLPVAVVGSVAVTDGGGSLTVDGTVSISGAVAIGDGSDTVEVLLSGADSTSNTDNELITAALGYLFNGTGWDRVRGDITNGLDVDVTRVSGTVTVDSELPAAAALTDGFANPTVPAVGSFGMVWNGSTWDRLPGNADAGQLVQGGAANDAPTDGNPVLIGERASTAVPTAVGSDGDVVYGWSDRRGARKVVMVDDAGDSIMDGTNDALRVNVVAGSGGATQYAEDTASAAGESVIMVGVVRKDSAASLVDADSDRTELQVDASGALRVTGGGGGTEYTEDIASPGDPVGGAVLLRRRDTPASEASAAGDWVAQNATQYGAGYVQILTSAGAFVDSFGGGVQYTEGDIDTTITGTALMWEDISNTLVVASAAKPVPVDVGGTVVVSDGGSSISVDDNGGSLTVDGTVTVTATDLDIRNLDVAQDDVRVGGMAALDAAVADNPVAVGGRASTALPTAVSADGDAVWGWFDRNGALIVNGRDAHDVAITANTNPLLVGARAQATAPTDVSADGDAVRLWALRSGALATVLTAAGALIGGDATNGLDVDVTRVQGTVTVSATDLDIRNLDVAQDDVRVGGMAALDAAVADNPVAIGGRASTAVPTAVSADGDAVWAWLDRQGAQKTVMVDDAGDSAMDGANNALRVNVVAGAAGGTQYTEGDIDASITGTAILWEDASDTLATVSESNPLPVIIWDGVDVVGVSSDNKLRVETVADEVEDSAIGNGQGGFAILGMRNDAAAARTDADGDATFMATDSAGRVGITDLGGSITVDHGATALEVVGDVAHDAAAPANPVVIGAQMETIADSAPGTRAGTDGDAVKLASADGAIFVAGRGPQSWQTRLASTSTVQTDGSIHSAPGSGLSLYVTDIIFSIGVATASSIFFEEGASTVLGPWYLEAIAGRGMALHFQTPFKVTANTALTVTNTGATTYSILVLGFTAPG